MSSTTASVASSANIVGARPRARFPKAKPNVLGGEKERRSAATNNCKHPGPTEGSEMNTLPPARKIVRSEFIAVEEAVDDSEQMEESGKHSLVKTTNAEPDNEQDCMPAPEVKIEAVGHLGLKEQSLITEDTTLSEVHSLFAMSERPLINLTLLSSLPKRINKKKWTSEETAKFHKALNSFGTDFSLMSKLFPKRTRHELKLKFKREERFNDTLLANTFLDHQQYDLSSFEESAVIESNCKSNVKCKKPESTVEARENLRSGRKSHFETSDAIESDVNESKCESELKYKKSEPAVKTTKNQRKGATKGRTGLKV